jgi:hypothetical protein
MKHRQGAILSHITPKNLLHENDYQSFSSTFKHLRYFFVSFWFVSQFFRFGSWRLIFFSFRFVSFRFVSFSNPFIFFSFHFSNFLVSFRFVSFLTLDFSFRFVSEFFPFFSISFRFVSCCLMCGFVNLRQFRDEQGTVQARYFWMQGNNSGTQSCWLAWYLLS